jgi:hypothetical protein
MFIIFSDHKTTYILNLYYIISKVRKTTFKDDAKS